MTLDLFYSCAHEISTAAVHWFLTPCCACAILSLLIEKIILESNNIRFE